MPTEIDAADWIALFGSLHRYQMIRLMMTGERTLSELAVVIQMETGRVQ